MTHILKYIKNFSVKALFLILLIVLVNACGGGGGGGGSKSGINSNYYVNLSQSSANFQAQANGALPASQTITVDFNGDALVVGYPPNTTVASWLDVTNLSGSSRPADIQLSINTSNLSVGTYSTTIRFVTGNLAGTEGNYTDLPVKYTITASGTATATPLNSVVQTTGLSASATQSLNIESSNVWTDMVGVILVATPTAISISNPNLIFNEVGSDAVEPQYLNITITSGESTTWVATTMADWLTLNAAGSSATGTTNDSLEVGIDTSNMSLSSGNHTATIEVLAVVGNQTLTSTIEVSLIVSAK